MFNLNEICRTKCGYDARIICVDAGVSNNCNIVAVVSGKNKTNGNVQAPIAYPFNAAGKYAGAGNANLDLISNEPDEEEKALISLLGDIAEGSVRDREEALLKAIRQIRSK